MQPTDNRFGLSTIAYRAGRQPDFLASLLAGLTSSDRPGLAQLRSRDLDDPTIALLDAFACVCDVMTFYTERLANESYLRTAEDAASLQELGRLLGYQPNPGVAAQTPLAFTVERPPTAPPAPPTDPGVMPAAGPEAITIPVGLRVMSVPGPGEQPQTFETVETCEARPEWSSASVAQTIAHPMKQGVTDGWFAGSALSLKVGDALLFVGTPTWSTLSAAKYGATDAADSWDFRLATAVTSDPAGQRTHVQWWPPLGSVDPGKQPATNPSVFVLRTKAGAFGANAPDWNAMGSKFQGDYPNGAGASDWPGFTAITNGVVAVEGAHGELVDGSWVVLDWATNRELYVVKSRTEGSKAKYAVSGRVTNLTLGGRDVSAYTTDDTPRAVTVYGGGEALTLCDAPDGSEVAQGSTTLSVEADFSTMPSGRTVLVSGSTIDGKPAVERASVDSVTATGAKSSVLTLNAGLANSYRRAGLVVLGNVALATHGTTVSQVLGDGNSTAAGQPFALSAGPLTYVQAANPRGSQSTLSVSVDGANWNLVESMYPAGPTDRDVVSEVTPRGGRIVRAGDGVHGSRLPTGVQNIRATYRQGLGAAGNVRVGALSQLTDRPLGLKAVSNPLAADGGVDPEQPDAARRAIPISVKTLGRAVSVEDYADFALASTGIAKAVSDVVNLSRGPTVVVTVAEVDGTAPAADKLTELTKALQAYGDPYVPVVVLPYQPATFVVTAKLAVAPDRVAATVEQAAADALAAAFAFDARSLGQPVFSSEIIAIVESVPGVLGIDIDGLHRTDSAGGDEPRIIAATMGVAGDGSATAAELLTIATPVTVPAVMS